MYGVCENVDNLNSPLRTLGFYVDSVDILDFRSLEGTRESSKA